MNDIAPTDTFAPSMAGTAGPELGWSADLRRLSAKRALPKRGSPMIMCEQAAVAGGGMGAMHLFDNGHGNGRWRRTALHSIAKRGETPVLEPNGRSRGTAMSYPAIPTLNLDPLLHNEATK